MGPSLQNPNKKKPDKFAGSLFFLVGLFLQNHKKTAEKTKFRKVLGVPVLENPVKLQKNPHFENFWVPKKSQKTAEKYKF
jgi:hypothetical protein